MKRNELRIICCVSCGRNDRPLHNLPSLSPDLKICDLCKPKYGTAGPATEADRTIHDSIIGLPSTFACRHCGGLVLMNPDGTVNLWCSDCERERRLLTQ